MKLLNFTIIKLTIALVIGIIIAHYFEPDFQIVIITSIVLIFCLSIYWFLLRSKIDQLPLFGIFTYLCMICLGIMAFQSQNEKLNPIHYTHFTNIDEQNELIITIAQRLKPDRYNNKYIAHLQSINNKPTSGKILVNVKSDSSATPLSVDDVLVVNTDFRSIQKPLNPHQFDYSKYLELKHVYSQIYIDKTKFIQLSSFKTSIYGFADQLRNLINKKLIEFGFKGDTLSIINALLLGQRQDIDKTIYNNYVNSGTIHILAVSGLHVGIILLILNFIFSPLLYIKHGRVIRPVIIVFLLWSFAIVAGLSPSVTRAVAMFSIISIGMHLKRPTNIYNTLVISAFLILLFKPNFLFEVGFQMSYLAVLGIVSIQPIIYQLWKPKYWIIDKPWQIFTVTLAAQFGVVPISLYYFHQFPGLFFISNLIVIPFLGLILGIGLLVIILALVNYLPELIVKVYSFIIESLNAFIAWIAKFEEFLLRDIPFTILQVVLSYLIIISLVQFYKHKNYYWIATTLITIIGFQGLLFYNSYSSKLNEFIVFNKSRQTVIGEKQNNNLKLYYDLNSFNFEDENLIKNYKVGEFIDSITVDNLQSVYQFKENIIFVIDSLGIHNGISFKPQYILIRNSPRINLNRLLDSITPKKVIADASNYKSYVKRWSKTCKNKKIPFHYTNEKGAFILR